jgi:CubicO group peptidase (beta-lactamase class C family)
MKTILSILLFCGVMSVVIGQQMLSESQILKLDSIATQDIPEGAPGMATAIIAGGKLIYQNYGGFECLEDSTKIDGNSRFNLASNGKQFTALAILVLEEENKLNLTDDFRKYIPEVFQSIEAKITIHDLLNHTSGIRDVYDLWSLQGKTWWEQVYNNQDAIRLLKAQQDLNFTPGTEYLYSNSNYILLAEIVESVSKKSFIDFTNELFAKLNMPDTSFENDYTAIAGPIAKAYFNFDTWTTYDWTWNVAGDGNFFSTLNDQVEWEKWVQGYGSPGISRNVIQKSQQLDRARTKFNYGYGLEFGEHKGLPIIFHEGATGAWKATVLRFETENISIITMTNSGKIIPSMQTRQMADAVLNLKDDASFIKTQPSKVGSFINEEELLGMYLTPNNFSFEFKKKDNGSIVLNRVGRGETEIVRESDNIFHQKFDPAFKQEFYRNEEGEMVVTAYYTNHAPYSLTRKDFDWSNFDFKKIAGVFVNDETNAEFSISHDSEKNYNVTLNGKAQSGLLVTPSKLLVNNYVLEMNTQQDSISSFRLHSDRIKNVKFSKKL